MPPNDLLNGVFDTEFNSPVLDRLNDYAGQGSNNPLDVEDPSPPPPPGGGGGGTTHNFLDDEGDTGTSYPDGYVTYDAAGNEYVYKGGVRVGTGNKRPETPTKPQDTTGDTRIYLEADINAFANDPAVKSVTRQGPDIVVTYTNGSVQRFYAVQGGYKAAAPTGGTSTTAPKPTIADFFANRGMASGDKFGAPQRFGNSNVILPHASAGGGKDLSGYFYGENFLTGAPELAGAHIGGQQFRPTGTGGTVDMVLAAFGVKPSGKLDQDIKTMSALVDMQAQALATMQAINPGATEAEAAAVVQAMLPKRPTAAATDETLFSMAPLDLGMVQAQGGTNLVGVGRHLGSDLGTVYPSIEGMSPIPVEGYSRWSRRSGRPIGVDEADQPWWRFYDWQNSGGDMRNNIRQSPRGSSSGGGGSSLSHGSYSFAEGGGFTTQEPIVMKGVDTDTIYGVAGGQPERIDVTPLAGTDVMLGRELEEYALQQEQAKQGAAAGAGPIVDTFLRSSGKNRVPYRNTYFPA